MNKNCVIVALMAVTSLPGSLVWGAREKLTFDVSLTIPNRAFYIMPSEPGWIHLPQEMVWNNINANFNTLTRYFEVRHDTSAIEARLETLPYLSNGLESQDILLWVTFNGVSVSTDITPREVVSAPEAAAGKRALLEIDAVKPVNGFRPGEYTGNVVLLFNAVAPEA